MSGELGPKHLEMLLTMVAKLTRVVVLTNPDNPSNIRQLQKIQAARKSGVTIWSVDARSPREIEHAFSTMAQKRTGAVIVASDGLFAQQLSQIAELAAANRLPAISAFREYVCGGWRLDELRREPGRSFSTRCHLCG